MAIETRHLHAGVRASTKRVLLVRPPLRVQVMVNEAHDPPGPRPSCDCIYAIRECLGALSRQGTASERQTNMRRHLALNLWKLGA